MQRDTYRPEEAADRVGVARSTLRLWSREFEASLSPAAGSTATEGGGRAPRRYTELDLSVLRSVARWRQEGCGYEECRQRLGAGEMADDGDVSPFGDTTLSLRTMEQHPILRTLSVALAAKDEAILELRGHLIAKDQVIASKEELIAALGRERDVAVAAVAQRRRPWWSRW